MEVATEVAVTAAMKRREARRSEDVCLLKMGVDEELEIEREGVGRNAWGVYCAPDLIS